MKTELKAELTKAIVPTQTECVCVKTIFMVKLKCSLNRSKIV